MANKQAVLYEKAGDHIALLTINRPEAMNAINDQVTQAMASYLKQTEEDRDIWVVILKGAGEKAFSAGADLKLISQGKSHLLRTDEGGFGGFVYAKRSKPWIAAVDGFALAGGTEFALACDMIIASERSSFGLPEVTRGIIAAAGGMFRLARLIPPKIAMEILATGQKINAARALELGMINKLVPAGKHLEAAFQLAESICQNAPIAVKESLNIARQAYELDEAALIQLSNEANQRIHKTEDAKEGPRAFVEKRKPIWKGK